MHKLWCEAYEGAVPERGCNGDSEVLSSVSAKESERRRALLAEHMMEVTPVRPGRSRSDIAAQLVVVTLAAATIVALIVLGAVQ
jgi:hypothetical protein